MNHIVLDDPNIKYFIKSVRINRPLAVPRRHMMDLETLLRLINYCELSHMSAIFKAAFLTTFMAF